MNDMVQKQARLIAGLEAVVKIPWNSLSLLDVIHSLAEKILWLGDFRSLMFALVDREAHLIRVMADFRIPIWRRGAKHRPRV